ncbi:MAG TPA: SDR family NAD(P)-dependent oxidoreductase [Acidimicrobiales bacterium]|nr:SDR family NAD(P)-dependent oxidoreductase [Acidimicrobiales bacterium]
MLVNNAAVVQSAPLADTSSAQIEAIFRVDFHTPVELMNEMARLSRGRGEDSWVINVVSPYRLIGVRKQSLYCAAKDALSRAGEATAVEADPEQRLTVVSVSPGVFKTAMRPPEANDAWLVHTFKTKIHRQPEAFARELVGRLQRGTIRPHWTMRMGWDGPGFEAVVRLFQSDWFLVALDRLIGQRKPAAPPADD